MTSGNLVFANQGWLLPAGIFALLILLVSAWTYYRARFPTPLKAACLFFRAAGLAALLFCLLEPLRISQRVKPGANFFAVVADNSQGLTIKDNNSTQSRGEQLRGMLDPNKNSWPAALAEHFTVRKFLFDAKLSTTRDFSELNFSGPSTALASALNGLEQRFRGQPLAGILLFTDGNATDIQEKIPTLSKSAPIFPVILGKDEPIKDISVQRIQVQQTAFEDAPVQVQGFVQAAGFAGQTLTARVYSHETSNNIPILQQVAEKTIQAAPGAMPSTVQFELKPVKKGVLFYTLQVLPQKHDPNTSPEATTTNNSRIFIVDRSKGPYRILYVAGRPNWEHKFLGRALQTDDQLQLVSLLRIARREPKFEFRGRRGESSNPLFRGFGDAATEEQERYNQPVLIRLNVKDAFELRGGFPKLPEDLFSYQALVLDDLEAEFFTHEQLLLIQRFVADRGGSLLMLGGPDSLADGKYQRTPLAKVLPVYLDPPSAGSGGLPDVRLQLTREGWLEPWVRLRSNQEEDTRQWDSIAPFKVLNQVGAAKAGAKVLAHASLAGKGTAPGLVIHRFGQGKSAVLTVGDIWKWGFRQPELAEDMSKLWRQIARYLVADVPPRVELSLAGNNPDQITTGIPFSATARDEKFEPLDAGEALFQVTYLGNAGTNQPAVRIPGESSADEVGLWKSSFVPRLPGPYKASVSVTNANGMEVGRAEIGWASEPGAEEFKSLTPNRGLLEEIARRTGGQTIAATDLNDFIKALPSKTAPITETWSQPIWHSPLIFLLAIALFAVEWGLRRWKGLP